MEKNNKKKYTRIILIAVLVILTLISLTVEPVKAWLKNVFTILSSMNVESVIEFIRSYGAWAAAISFFLMILQSVAAPIPAFLITFANAAIFGWVKGALLSWTSAMAGAAVCFYISRILGRSAVEKLAGKTALGSVDVFFKRYGNHAVLVCRLLPFISFDLVSYAAGLTGMGFWGFFIATGIGQLPATIVYSYVGDMLTGGMKYFVTGLLILFALTAAIALGKKVYNDKHADEEAESKSLNSAEEALSEE